MTSLEWIKLYEAFEGFRTQAESQRLYGDILSKIEDDLFGRCPIPQPPAYRIYAGDNIKKGRCVYDH